MSIDNPNTMTLKKKHQDTIVPKIQNVAKFIKNIITKEKKTCTPIILEPKKHLLTFSKCEFYSSGKCF